jgi:hypothetical protein
MPLPEFKKAETAVGQLGLTTFIEDHWNLIQEKMRKCDEEVNAAKDKGQAFGDMTFIATCLPLAAGIVHVGSTLDAFKNAQKEVREGVNLPDSTSVLSALVLVYLVQTGHDKNPGDAAWDRIYGRVKRFLTSEILPVPGPTT